MTGVPYPVINRAVFGVKGANIPAIIRGLIAVAWYGVQTFLASEALVIVFLKFIPGMAPCDDVEQNGFLGLSALGWICLRASSGWPRPRCSGTAWRPSASSSTSPAPPSTW